MNYRFHIGAQFSYTAGPFNESYKVTVTDIAIIADEQGIETRLYTKNDHDKKDQQPACITPDNFYRSLAHINAIQIA